MDEADRSGGKPSRARPAAAEGSTISASIDCERLCVELAGLFQTSFDHSERVAAIAAQLRSVLSAATTPPDPQRWLALLPLLRQRRGPMAQALFDLLAHVASISADPRPIALGLLECADSARIDQAFALTSRLLQAGRLTLDSALVAAVADRLSSADPDFATTDTLRAARDALWADARSPAGRVDRLRELLAHGVSLSERRLAARLLDLDGTPAPPETAETLLGADAARFLAPYLAFTRATHLDVLGLAAAPHLADQTIPSLQLARKSVGESLLRKVIADLGWARVNLGLEVRRFVGCRVAGSLPLLVAPAEAALLSACDNVQRSSESWLFIAHGGLPPATRSQSDGEDPVARFRSYNLAHAQLLGFLLDLSPLSRERVHEILARVDRVVEDFVALFRTYSEECAILPALYADLKARILSELAQDTGGPQLSPELTRLVQMFEDPRSLGEVRTLHGLKRYLHQRGLRLGFQLVGRTLATNRTVDLVLASRRRLQATIRRIRYTDFEADPEDDSSGGVPYPVAVVADGFARQLAFGQESFPQVDAYCYGNEVHYYLSYGSHPAFLRIDYSPPLSGGMIDLGYYGVSKFELSGHPDTALTAVSGFFRQLEFDVRVDNTHLHVRYDKERAMSLGEICRKAEALFRLAPYMMDIDWVIGSLHLNPEARRAVVREWSESFVRWGVLPLRDLLTEDRTGIRVLPESAVGPVADEVVWDGRGAYLDRFGMPLAEDFHASILSVLENTGLDFLWPMELGESRVVGQIDLDRLLLEPLRQAVARGEVIEAADGFRPQSPDLFRREHEAERFAAILSSDIECRAAAQLAELVIPLERAMRFRTTGSLNGYAVQQAVLALRGGGISVHVLRDALGVIRLALFTRDGTLCQRRRHANDPWISNADCDASRLAALLLRNNYLAPGVETGPRTEKTARADIAALFARLNPNRRRSDLFGERIVEGLRASPGRAVGRVVLATAGRGPEDCADAVLIAPTVGPQDNALLQACAGIVSTGGGILSHAGLIAAQFGKPALIIQGEWLHAAAEPPALLYRITEFVEEEKRVDGYHIALYRNQREREHRLVDGDLVILNADRGTLSVLGHERETLALYEGFWRFAEIGWPLRQARDPHELLGLRGRLLQARQLMERLLGRLRDGSLAHYALHEILLGEEFSGCDDERPRLLRQLLGNPHIGSIVGQHLRGFVAHLSEQARAATDAAQSRIPAAPDLYEILLRRVRVRRLAATLGQLRLSLSGSDFEVESIGEDVLADIDTDARARLATLRSSQCARLDAAANAMGRRHLLRQLERMDDVLGIAEGSDVEVCRMRDQLAESDRRRHELLARQVTLTSADGGFELTPLIGLKAANLAEIARLTAADMVPEWFVVTDRVFQDLLAAPLDPSRVPSDATLPVGATLRDAIETILALPKVDGEAKSQQIRALWRNMPLSEEVRHGVLAAYQRLAASGPEAETPYVAIRSSSREEDAEAAARAGEFDTFLFIRGADALLDHLRLAWAGLWTARAIQNRALSAAGPTETGGGIIVQRMIKSRVSGVLHTINMVSGEPGEIVINVGLGLGEGIVSGVVPADHIVVAKPEHTGHEPLRFRYTIADKREQVVPDARSGLGTRRAETLYHQRFRAAVEYVELHELVTAAMRLERAYGYPLDIEFAFEGMRLWILQARPVPTYRTVLQETLEHWPLVSARPSTSAGRAAEVRP